MMTRIERALSLSHMIWAGFAALLLCLGLSAQAQVVYYHNDVAGSPVAATDEAGNLLWRESYRPYGDRILKPVTTNTQWFHGKPLDADTGMQDFGARNYDAVLGRFLSIDPVDFMPDNVHSFNRYNYGNNNPLKYKDPDGRYAFLAWIAHLLRVGQATAAATSNASAAVVGVAGAAVISQELSDSGQQSESGQQSQQGQQQSNTGTDNGDKKPSTPTGQRGSPIEVKPGTNKPTAIGGRDYSGHALDRMQGRGVPPSAVEDAIQSGTKSPGNTPGTTVHTGSNGVVVVTGNGGRVVTVIPR